MSGSVKTCAAEDEGVPEVRPDLKNYAIAYFCCILLYLFAPSDLPV